MAGEPPTDALIGMNMSRRSTLSLFCIGVVCCLSSGCLTSRESLVVSPDFPLPDGTLMQPHKVENGTVEVSSKDGLGELTIENGWYVYASPGEDRPMIFRLHRVEDSGFIIMFHQRQEKPEFLYGWIERQGDYYLLYSVEGEDFRDWAGHVGLSPQGWQMTGSNVEVNSLAFLASILPRMISAGFHGPVAAYKPVPESDDLEAERKAIEALNRRIAEVDDELRKLCGGRVCAKTSDGRDIYRTETYDPPRWYFEDGRLAPRAEWPER